MAKEKVLYRRWELFWGGMVDVFAVTVGVSVTLAESALAFATMKCAGAA